MTEIRSLRSYKSSCDPNFIYDTIADAIKNDVAVNDELEQLGHTDAFVRTLPEDIRAKCRFASDVASAAEVIINGAQYIKNHRQLLHLARLCGCERDPTRENGIYFSHENPEYLRTEELKNALARFF
ncbi:hypothetical protein Ndes2437A_g03144 [Nannochloris sp. 'desiccata']